MAADKVAQSGAKKKKRRGKVVINAEWCKGCGFCVEFCPKGVLAVSQDFNSKGYHPPYVKAEQDCTQCELCSMYCPDFAIWLEYEDEKES